MVLNYRGSSFDFLLSFASFFCDFHLEKVLLIVEFKGESKFAIETILIISSIVLICILQVKNIVSFLFRKKMFILGHGANPKMDWIN